MSFPASATESGLQGRRSELLVASSLEISPRELHRAPEVAVAAKSPRRSGYRSLESYDPAAELRRWSDGREVASSATRHGETPLEVTLPAHGAPRYARLVADAPTDFSGWRARVSFPAGDWLEVEPDGRVPIDLQQVMNALDVRASTEDHQPPSRS